MASIGVEFKLKRLELNNKKIKMQIVSYYNTKIYSSLLYISGIQQGKNDINL